MQSGILEAWDELVDECRSTSAPKPLPCPICGKSEDLKQCSRCKLVGYCGSKHQKAHWAIHKRQCVGAEARARFVQRELAGSNLIWLFGLLDKLPENKRELAEALVRHARQAGAVPKDRDVAVNFRAFSAEPGHCGVEVQPLRISVQTVVVGTARSPAALTASYTKSIEDGHTTFHHDLCGPYEEPLAVVSWKPKTGDRLPGGSAAVES